jgi:Tfp pilus assembly protein FimT
MISKSNSFQFGASFLELLVVIALLGIMSGLMMPAINSWTIRSRIEGDYRSTLAQIEYLKTRVRVLNGTAVLICNNNSKLTYKVSTNYQSSNNIVDANFDSSVAEDPLIKAQDFNVLSGKTNLVSKICDGHRGILASSGSSGVEGTQPTENIEIELNYNNDHLMYPAYLIKLDQSTSFVQRFLWNKDNGQWRELD